MTRQLFIGLFTEGSTDNRFLESVVKRAFDEAAFEAVGDFEIYLQPINLSKQGLSFAEQVIQAAKKGLEQFGITILCIHRDADNENDSNVFQNSINPALYELSKKKDKEYCKVTTVIVPVQMMEAWLLADKDLFKKEIGTSKTDSELGINRSPETIADPKEIIKEAIRIARQDLTQKRRKDLVISEIYMPLGQKISIDKLNTLKSYLKFKQSVQSAFKVLNYLQ
jgi:hypothetical protein